MTFYHPTDTIYLDDKILVKNLQKMYKTDFYYKEMNYTLCLSTNHLYLQNKKLKLNNNSFITISCDAVIAAISNVCKHNVIAMVHNYK